MVTVWRPIAALALVITAAAAPPVLVVANGNSAVSKSVAEYYARKRQLPRSAVCFVEAPEKETITRQEYLSLERAVGRCLTAGRTESTLYLVTTLGVPLRVSGSGGMDGEQASVDSELTLLYAKIHGTTVPVKGYVPNPLFGNRGAAFGHPAMRMYLVTRLAAYDFEGARGLIDRSLKAQNAGIFVLDAKAGRTAVGDNWLLDAAIALPSDRTVFDDTDKVVYGAKNVIGFASWGSNDPNRTGRSPGFSWLPGAVMTEYVSTNARTFQRPPSAWKPGTWKDRSTWFAGSPQTLIGDYIEEGVTGVAGNVYEPYLQLTPRPNILLKAWYDGYKLAEAFYLSMPALSWQTIVIGDPLCTLGPPNRQ